MRNFTKKVLMLFVALSLVSNTFSADTKRYVFALGGHEAGSSDWQETWVDLRLNDVDRILYIWPDGNSLAGTTAVGTGALGQPGYQAFTVGSLGWWGCGYLVGPDSGNPNSEIDLTDVDASEGSGWYLNFAVRTDCATDITINLYGCSPDPSDPFITDRTIGRYRLTKENLPLAKRDKTQWVEYQVPLSKFEPYKEDIFTPSLKLNFSVPLKKQNYLTFNGGNDTGSFIAWDNVYIGKKDDTGIFNPKVDNLDIKIAGNTLLVQNNTDQISIYSVAGTQVLQSKVNDIDISGLTSGVYIVKAGNAVAKFLK